MNDKIQLAAMGEHMAEQAAQPLRTAKRIEELEAQVLVMAELLRETLTYAEGPRWQSLIDDRKAHLFLGRIDSALAGNLPIQGTPECWHLVPAKPTPAMRDAMRNGSRKDWPSDELCNVRYAAMLAAAPSLDSAK